MKPLFPQFDLRKIILSVVKLPLLLFITGFALANLSLLQTWSTSWQTEAHWQQIVVVAKIVGRIGMAISWVLFIYLLLATFIRVYRRALSSEQTTLSYILNTIEKALKIIFIFFAFRSILAVLNINPQEFDIVRKIITLFIIIVVAWFALKIVSTFEMVAYSRNSQQHLNRNSINNYTRIHLIRNIVVVLIFVIAIASALMMFDGVRNIGISLLASAGFLTAIIGLAAQHSLGSFLSGIQLAFSQPFQIGDTITVENENGVIEEITLSYVKLKLGNGQQFILPANYFLQKPFRNWSYYNEGMQGEITQVIRAEVPLALIREELSKIVDDSKKIRAINITNFTRNNFEIRIILSAESLSTLDKLKNLIRERLFEISRKTDQLNSK